MVRLFLGEVGGKLDTRKGLLAINPVDCNIITNHMHVDFYTGDYSDEKKIISIEIITSINIS